MSDIRYPVRKDIEDWIEFLKETNKVFRLALPTTDEQWYACVLEVIERVRYSYSPNTLHRRAAELFYNINKAHNYVDGNKRTSILIVYLFYVLNDRIIVKRADVRDLAKSVARSHGRERHDQWIDKIERLFEACTEPLK